MQIITKPLFSLVGEQKVFSLVAANDPTLVVLGGKLIVVTDIVQPSLILLGAETPAKLGELVVIEGSLLGACSQFVKSAKIVWNVTENGVSKQCWTQGRNVVFGAGVAHTTLNVEATLTLTYLADTQQVQKTVYASAHVQVGDGAPDPTPSPIPGGIQSLVAIWAKDPAVVVADGTGRNAARALALSFKTLSQNIGSPDLADIAAILTKTKSNNNESLNSVGVDPHSWDNWGKRLQTYLFAEYTAKRMVTVNQIKKTWWDISAGLWTVN